MARSRAELGELIAKIFDRLDAQFPGAEIEDAILLVEVSDPDDTVLLEDGSDEGREVPATTVMLESTDDRVVVQAGIIEFARRLLSRETYDED